MRSWPSAPCGHERPRHCIRRPTQSGNWDYYLPVYGPVAGHTRSHNQASRAFPLMHPQLRVFPDLTSAIIFTRMAPQSHQNRPIRRCLSSLPRLSRKTRYPYRSPSTITSGVDAPNQFSVLLHGPSWPSARQPSTSCLPEDRGRPRRAVTRRHVRRPIQSGNGYYCLSLVEGAR
jgi:hypothetical protein